MTRNLPDEILLKIFNDLTPSNLLNCQQVCRSWYSPAHIKLLKQVKLSSSQAIKQFIASFDRNSSQTYVKAVKDIQVQSEYCVLTQTVLEKETIENLFFRFPNLQKVHIEYSSLLRNFDEDLCDTLLLRCPNLDTFNVGSDDEGAEYCTSLLKVRPLLTDMQLSCDNLDADTVDLVQFITQFPRLQSINCMDDPILSFDSCLPILEQLSNINTLYLALNEDDEEDFGEEYLSTKPKETQELVKKRLSNITGLTLVAYDYVGNVLKFVSEYFTGLTYFHLEREFQELEPDEEQDLFIGNALNLIPLVKDYYSADFDDMCFASLSNCFTSLIQNMFDKVPPIHKQSNSRVLYITRSPMDQVDVFVLWFLDYKKPCSMLMDTEKYLRLLGTMSSLKEVNLDVPATFLGSENQDNQPYAGPVLDQVREATFKATQDGALQSLLNSCCYTFPNLKRLNIYNFSGNWTAHIGEFFVDLKNYSIEKLLLDTKSIVSKMNKFKFTYFVVKVEIRSSGKCYLYKVSLYRPSCSMISLNDLEDCSCGKDYFRIRLIIDNLKQVELPVLKNKIARTHTIILD